MTSVLDHIHIYATSPADTMAFYEDVLGAERIGPLPTAGSDTIHLLILGGQYLAVSRFPEGVEPTTPPDYVHGALATGYGVAHFGLNVDDLDGVMGKLKAAGTEVHGDPESSGPLRFVYFTGPDGVVIELTQYVLPAKLRPVAAGLKAFNRFVHMGRRLIAKQMINAL